MSTAQIEQAKQTVQALKLNTKKEVFAKYVSQCLGRVQNANIAEQRKAWMIYDIIRSQYNTTIADLVA